MQRKTKTFPIPMPDRGVNKYDPPPFMNKRESPNAINCRYDKGQVGPRPGLANYGTSSGTEMPFGAGGADEVCLGLGVFTMLDGTEKLVGVSDSELYKYNDGATKWELMKAGGFTMSSTIADYVSFTHCVNANGTLADGYYFIICNDNDPIVQWDGGTTPANLLGGDGYQTPTTHSAQMVFTFKDCLCLLRPVIDSAVASHQLRWSAVGTIDQWNVASSTAGFLNFYETPGALVWAGKLGDYWAIYKTDAICLFRYVGGTDLFTYDTVVYKASLLSPGLLAVLEGEHIFITKNNIYRWAGGPIPTPIGKRIFEDFKDNVNFDALSACRTLVDLENTRVIFFYPSGSNTTADRAIIYDYKEDNFLPDTYTPRITAAAMWSSYDRRVYDDEPKDATHQYDDYGTLTYDDFAPKEGQNVPLVGTSLGYVCQQSLANTSDVEAATYSIDQSHETIDIVIDKEKYRKRKVRFMGLEFEAKGDSVTLTYSLDGGKTWTAMETVALTGDWTLYTADFHTTATMIRFKARNNTEASNFSIRWLGAKHYPKGAAA